MATEQIEPIQRAIQSLRGLSIGDAIGAAFGEGGDPRTARLDGVDRKIPSGPWQWTDDTHMSISVVEILAEYGEIVQDELAYRFAQRFEDEPYRGYGNGAQWLLSQLSDGQPWRRLTRELFNGGSYGNGAAMRAAPIGAYFSGAPKKAASQARKSAVITHAHRDGQAGAIAVAVAAAIVNDAAMHDPCQFLSGVLHYVPDSETRDGIESALSIKSTNLDRAVRELGTGLCVSSQDTVPFCLWCVAHHRGDFEEAIWQAISGGGDRDTTCAIVGGIAAMTSEIPEEWRCRSEELPDSFGIE